MEVDVDVASSSVARHVVGLVAGAAKSVVVDMGILLQVGRAARCLKGVVGQILPYRLMHVEQCKVNYFY